MNNIALACFVILLISSAPAAAIEENNWGIAAGFRSAKIPYPTKDEQVDDFIPLLFYDGDRFFIRGLTGGVKAHTHDKLQFNLIGRYRYFDIPAEFQNLVQGNALDVGAQVIYNISDDLETSLEVMSDTSGRLYAAIDARTYWDKGSWDIFPYATLRFKSDKFNSHYYGLDGFVNPDNPTNKIDNKIGSGLDLTIGSEIRYHVTSNFYLLGRAQITSLDDITRSSPTIDHRTYGEVYFGIAFFNDKTKPLKSSLNAKPYLRLAHGWATPSNMSDILALNSEGDAQSNQLSSLFYGHPIADSLFGIEAFDIYITTGLVYHHGSTPYQQTLYPGQGINTAELNNLGNNPCNGISPCTITYDSQPTNEYVLAIKAYYNLNWPTRWRFGLAEGLSYVENVTNIEQREMDQKGYRSSKLMNYLDVTLDFELGDLFAVDAMHDLYLGIGIHHRSSIFETASAFGRIKGGSNYNSLYLQYHF